MKRILIVYHSQWKGNTQRMAELVADGARQVKGVQVEMVNAHGKSVDMAATEAADAYALGSPDYFSYMAGGLKQFFDDLCIADWAGRKVRGKPCAMFLSHNGGGKGIESIEKFAKTFDLKPVAPSVVVRELPQGDEIDRCIALGRALGDAVTQGA